MAKNLLDWGTLPLLSLRNARKVRFDVGGRAIPAMTRERHLRLEQHCVIRDRRKAKRLQTVTEGVVPLLELLSLIEEAT